MLTRFGPDHRLNQSRLFTAPKLTCSNSLCYSGYIKRSYHEWMCLIYLSITCHFNFTNGIFFFVIHWSHTQSAFSSFVNRLYACSVRPAQIRWYHWLQPLSQNIAASSSLTSLRQVPQGKLCTGTSGGMLGTVCC